MMFPLCKHCLCDKGDGQNLLIKPSAGESERHTHTPNYLSPVQALRGNGVMYESEWIFGRRKSELLMYCGCENDLVTLVRNLEWCSSSGAITIPHLTPSLQT